MYKVKKKIQIKYKYMKNGSSYKQFLVVNIIF